jgi:hypothetical protein
MHRFAQRTLEDKRDPHVGQARRKPAHAARVGDQRRAAPLAQQRPKPGTTSASIGEKQRKK